MRRWRRAGYGIADLGLSGAELLLQLYLMEYYIRAVGMSPWLAGVALALATFWDAVSDPLMGGILDRTRSRYGRFLPYLLAGALLYALGLIVLFSPPAGMGEPMAFLYLLLSYLWVNTGMTVVGVPHIAMAGALTADTHVRTELYGWRLIFGTVGLFIGILSPLVAAQWAGVAADSAEGLRASRMGGAWILAGCLVVTVVLTVLATRSLPDHGAAAARQHPPLRHLYRSAMELVRGRAFRLLLIAFVLVAAGRAMNATLALPFYKDSLQLSEAAIQGPILSTFTLCIVLAVPLWVTLGRRFGKQRPAFWGLLALALLTLIAYPLFPDGVVWAPVIAAVIGGVAVAAIILFESLVTDLADADQRRSGVNREGLYFGLWRMAQKLTRSLMLAGTGLLLSAIGYQEGVALQAESTQRALAWLFGPGVGVLFLAGALVFRQMPDTVSPRHNDDKQRTTT